MTGQGGWPMTCRARPRRRPFFAGTYFPRAHSDSCSQPPSEAWREHAGRCATGRRAGQWRRCHRRRARRATGRPDGGTTSTAPPPFWRPEFDAAHGGFGGAPKFPPSMVLEFLLRHHERTGDPMSLAMVGTTCEAMARGGIYDQLGGGFARYSVDAGWVVPHFEKMLYDNAQLLGVYAWWRRTGSPLASASPERPPTSCCGSCARPRVGSPRRWTPTRGRGGLDSTSGHRHQLSRRARRDDGAWAAEAVRRTTEGTFEHGASTLQLPADPNDPARWTAYAASAARGARGPGPRRPGTTRWSRPGTDSRSPVWPRLGCCSTDRST